MEAFQYHGSCLASFQTQLSLEYVSSLEQTMALSVVEVDAELIDYSNYVNARRFLGFICNLICHREE